MAQQEKAEPGKFSPTWESLSQYEVPEWFRNAKFGIWAHWGPQCQPEAGDWYGRGMYEEGGAAYKWHLEHYGHPSEFGFKDVINEWKAEKWNPERLGSTPGAEGNCLLGAANVVAGIKTPPFRGPPPGSKVAK